MPEFMHFEVWQLQRVLDARARESVPLSLSKYTSKCIVQLDTENTQYTSKCTVITTTQSGTERR